MSCISMTPIQCSSLVHLWHHEEQQILILLFWGRVQVEGTLEGGKILAISPYHLASSLKACSLRSVLRSVFFLDSNHGKTACSSGSSFWAATQSVTCISTRTHPVVTHTSSFLCWSLSITVGFSSSTPWGAPMVAPSRTDCMASSPRQVVIWLNASATVLSHPFWYSNWKLNLARAPTHQ